MADPISAPRCEMPLLSNAVPDAGSGAKTAAIKTIIDTPTLLYKFMASPFCPIILLARISMLQGGVSETSSDVKD